MLFYFIVDVYGQLRKERSDDCVGNPIVPVSCYDRKFCQMCDWQVMYMNDEQVYQIEEQEMQS